MRAMAAERIRPSVTGGQDEVAPRVVTEHREPLQVHAELEDQHQAQPERRDREAEGGENGDRQVDHRVAVDGGDDAGQHAEHDRDQHAGAARRRVFG
jgi:hypothetical protein